MEKEKKYNEIKKQYDVLKEENKIIKYANRKRNKIIFWNGTLGYDDRINEK